MRSRPGPKPKGDRTAATIRDDRRRMEYYREQAKRLNMPLSDYLARQLAVVHNLAEPVEESESESQQPYLLGA